MAAESDWDEAGPLPATFACTTRGGGMGILQAPGIDGQGSSRARARWRPLSRADGQPYNGGRRGVSLELGGTHAGHVRASRSRRRGDPQVVFGRASPRHAGAGGP